MRLFAVSELALSTCILVLAITCAALSLAGCDMRRNGDFCCVGAACEAEGAPSPSLCGTGLICVASASTCVPAESTCSQVSDCTDPGRNQCVGGACIGCMDDAECPVERPACGDLLDCGGCGSDADCSRFPDRSRCDGSSGACVGCVGASECTAGEPICDIVCRSCLVDSECPLSGVCDFPERGSQQRACIDPGKVLYVSTLGADTSTCAQGEPCKSVQRAVDLVDGVRRWIVLGPGEHASAGSVSIQAKTVTIIGRLETPGYILNSALTTSGAALPVVKVAGASDVSLRGLEVRGSSTEGDGLECAGGGTLQPRVTLEDVALGGIAGRAIASTSCVVAIRRAHIMGGSRGGLVAEGGRVSIVESEFQSGGQGGISIASASFDLVNNIIHNNGSLDSLIGGVRLAQITSKMTGRFEYNTVTANDCTGCTASGVECIDVTAPLGLANNIVYGNRDDGPTQVGGDENCAWTFSNIGPLAAPAGLGNINADPMWVDRDRNDFHIEVSSPAVDAADPSSMVSSDVDGEQRPRGVRRDIGADEAN